MTHEFPAEIRERAKQAAPSEGLAVLQVLAEEGPTTDTVIADRVGLNTSAVRRTLYKLFEARVADYDEERDAAKGWLTYEWRYTPKQARRVIEAERRERAEQIRETIEELRSHERYVCPSGHERVSFEEAMESEFHCSTCNASLEHEDSAQRVDALQDELAAIEQGLAQA